MDEMNPSRSGILVGSKLCPQGILAAESLPAVQRPSRKWSRLFVGEFARCRSIGQGQNSVDCYLKTLHGGCFVGERMKMEVH